MIAASWLLTRVQVKEKVEAFVQNFAAGLILGAVAGELFPELLDHSRGVSLLGVTVGFAIGIGAIHGLEYLVEFLEKMPVDGITTSTHYSASSPSLTYPAGFEADEAAMLYRTPVVDDVHAERASAALSRPENRTHLRSQLHDLVDTIHLVDAKAHELEASTNAKQRELLADSIDEHVHTLHYKLDRCRRLLLIGASDGESEGPSQVEEGRLAANATNPLHAAHSVPSSSTSSSPTPSSTRTFPDSSSRTASMLEHQQRLQRGVTGLRLMGEHLLDHAEETNLGKHTLREMHAHLHTLDHQAAALHQQIEAIGAHWRPPAAALPNTQDGDRLPAALVAPVCADCLADGLLVGLTATISFRAGLVLGLANGLEMGVLGAAYSARLSRCTRTPAGKRTIALYAPPLLMLFAAGVGGLLGAAADGPGMLAVRVGLVAFGVVSLLGLVCNELLAEARSLQGDEERWWVSAALFLGVYVVLVLDHIL